MPAQVKDDNAANGGPERPAGMCALVNGCYYMNKTHWNSIKVDGSVPDDLLKDLLDRSYALVLSGFSKKKQAEILS